jgi:hypothetical protein
MSTHATPQDIRKSLSHPVIDGDGHWVEYTPVFAERIRKVTGDLGANGFLQSQRRIPDSLSLTARQRAERGIAMEGFWGRQSVNTGDRATAMMPRMLYDRLEELGTDFGIVYPTAGLGLPRIADDATRRATIRGFNVVTYEYFKDLGDKLTPAAVIPVHTPDEAIEELTFVTSELGAKVCMFGSGVRRPIPHAKGASPDLARYAQSFDTTIPCGRSVESSGSRRPSTPAAAPTASATARPTSRSTTSVTSPRPATTWPRPCSSEA